MSSILVMVLIVLEERQPKGKFCAFAFDALTIDLASMQLDATFDDDETQARAGKMAGIGPAVERIEKLLLIGQRDANAPVPHAKNGIAFLSFDSEFHRC